MKKKWKAFPHPDEGFDYAGPALKRTWTRLHQGDREPFPDAKRVAGLLAASPAAKKGAGKAASDPDALAEQLQEAWRLFHRGDFQAAAELGAKLGPLGTAVASKATGIYATYLEDDEPARLAILDRAIEHAEAGRLALPEDANANYFVGYLLGRYSQCISVLQALSQGLGGRVKKALDRTLELEPEHAEAHSASGTYHAEILDKVGALVGSLTYGASKDKALAHYAKAAEYAPRSPIVRVEHAGGLLMMYGRSRKEEAARLYTAATKLKPADAMERLDIELARSRLAELD